jgi:hypothetical protein
VLFTLDKDFGELVFRRGLSAGIAVVLFRDLPGSPEAITEIAMSLIESHAEMAGAFYVVTRDRVRVRSLPKP